MIDFETINGIFECSGFVTKLTISGDIEVAGPAGTAVLDKVIMQTTRSEFVQIAREVGIELEVI